MANSKRSWRDVYFHKEVLPMVLKGMVRAAFPFVKDLKDAKQWVSSMFLAGMVPDPTTGELSPIVFRTNWLNDDEYDKFIRQVKDYCINAFGLYVDEQEERQGINLEDDPDFYLESPTY